MTFSLKEFIIGGRAFCCCLPVRFGVLVMSLLSILFTGILSVIIWFEVARSQLPGGLRPAFILAGLVESLLFLASILGFVGAVVRKQLFVVIYAFFIYFHVLLNLAVASYFLFMVTHATNEDIQAACEKGLQNMGSKSQCKGLLNITQGVFAGAVSLVLLIEIYGAIIVTRYFRQLRGEKSTARASRIATDSAFKLRQKHARYASDGAQDIRLLDQDFDPYAEHISAADHFSTMPALHETEDGYGYGHWTHEQTAVDEKERSQKERVAEAAWENVASVTAIRLSLPAMSRNSSSGGQKTLL